MIPLTYRLFRKQARLAVLLLVCVVPGVRGQGLQEVNDFGDNPGNLRMFYYQPVANAGTSNGKQPLVVVLHGCTQSAGIIAAQTGWNKLADAYGFTVLYPEQKLINNPERCFCWYRRGDITKGKGEDVSILEMIDYMKSHFRLDSSKVFITGLSAGAAMSVVLMATYPETFNAGAIFAGGPYKATTSVFMAYPAMAGWVHKTPAKWGLKVTKQNRGYIGAYPRMIIYQGNKDRIVNRSNGFELVKQWTNLHHLDTVPTTQIDHYAGVKDIRRTSFCNNDKREQVVYYQINKLGHAYLIDPGPCLDQGGKRGIFSKDKNYHATWWTALDFGLVKMDSIQGQPVVSHTAGDLVYSVPEHSGSSYSWICPEGSIVVAGAQSHSATIRWGAKSGILRVEETDANGCRRYHPDLLITVLKP